MAKRQLRRPMIVEHDVGDAIQTLMTGNGHNRQRKLADEVGIDRNQALRTTAHEHAWILLDKIAAMAMVGDEVEILFLEQAVPDAVRHFCMIANRKDRNCN